MGRKVHPIGFRLKINKTWDGRWYAEGEDYVNNLHQDFAIRDLIGEQAPRAGVSRIDGCEQDASVRATTALASAGEMRGSERAGGSRC